MSTSATNAPILGIDLGTSNCCTAIWSSKSATNQQIDIVRNAQGDRTTASVVALQQDGTVMIGAPARRQAVMNPRDTISEVKRLVGLPYYSAEVRAAKEVLPYEILRAKNGDAWVKACNRVLSPQEVQAYILEELVRSSAKYLGRPATQAVITVPAFYDETQRQAVRDSAAIAGIEIARILSEPSAAALAYGYSEHNQRKIAVVDLGGGTLDVTIMSINRGLCKVLSTDGDNSLGGADFDRSLASHFAEDIRNTHNVDVREDPVAMQRLLMEAENAKKSLSGQSLVEIQLPYLAQKGPDTVNFSYQLAKAEYENIVAPLVHQIIGPCAEAVANAGLSPSDLDDVILIGGMTRSPIVNTCIGKFFGTKPLLRINPDEAVAMGAALLGASLSGIMDEVKFVDVVPRTIGLAAAGDRYVPLIQKSSPLPAACKKAFATTKDQQESFELDVLQGESKIASDNRQLAHIRIAPISLAQAGKVILELHIGMHQDGSLHVRAKERGASEERKVTIEASSGLNKAQLATLVEAHGKARGEVGTSAQASEAGGGFSIVMSDRPASTSPPNTSPLVLRTPTPQPPLLAVDKQPTQSPSSPHSRAQTSVHASSRTYPWPWIVLAGVAITASVLFFLLR